MVTIGKYELHEQVGRGGYGVVYRATDVSLGRDVALKILHPQLTTDPDFINRFRNEARIIASLHNRNIVIVYELDEVDGRVFIAMEYLSGGSLSQRLEKFGAMSTDDAVSVLKQVCDGLKSAHEMNLVHRDIKPGNILFDNEGRAILADFGLSRAIQVSSMSTNSSGNVGTPAYMAPEIWRGKPITPRSDIYSLGCVLYEMLTGKVLFTGDSPADVMTKHVLDSPQIPAEFPGVIKKILSKMLAKNPDERYQSVQELNEELQRIPIAIRMKKYNTNSRTSEIAKDNDSQTINEGILFSDIQPSIKISQGSSNKEPQHSQMKTASNRKVGKILTLSFMGFLVIGVIVTSIIFKPRYVPLSPTSMGTFKQTSTPKPVLTSTRFSTATKPPTAMVPTKILTKSTPAYQALLKNEVRCRKGPNELMYGADYSLQPQKIILLGRNSDGTWVNFKTIDGNSSCWTKTSYIDFSGEIFDIQVVKIPPITGTIYFAYTDASCEALLDDGLYHNMWNGSVCNAIPACYVNYGDQATGSFFLSSSEATANFSKKNGTWKMLNVYSYSSDAIQPSSLVVPIACPGSIIGTP